MKSKIILAAPADKTVVFGEGDALALLALVGEAPGREEEAAGRPFVGRAGRLLDTLLVEAGIERRKTWVTNVVKWRPTAEKAPGVRTRAPTRAEVIQSLKWLEMELGLIRPVIILCLGTVAARALIFPSFRMGSERGLWRPGPAGSSAMATFHPAYCLRRGGPSGPVGRLVAGDLRTVRTAWEGLMNRSRR